MPSVEPRILQAHLERMDIETCRALASDLWEARGFDIQWEGRVIIAKDHNRTTTIYPVVPTRGRSVTLPDRSIDIVLVPRHEQDIGPFDTNGDVRLFDVTDLRDHLLYAIDRTTMAELCRDHLGKSPADLQLPLRDRVRHRVGTLPAGVAVLLLVLAILGVVASSGVVPTVVPNAPLAGPLHVVSTDSPTEDRTADTGAISRTATPTPPVLPGEVSDEQGRVVNAKRLLAVNRRIRANHAYRLERTATITGGGPNSSVTFVWNRTVGTNQSLVERLRVSHTGPVTPTVVNSTLWKNDSEIRTRSVLSNGQVLVSRLPHSPSHHRIGLQLHRHVLTASEYRVSERTVSTTVIVPTAPIRLSRPLVPVSVGSPRNVNARLVVDDSGLIRRVAVSYDANLGNRTVEIRLRHRITLLTETQVGPPSWIES